MRYLIAFLLNCLLVIGAQAQSPFQSEITTKKKPWTEKSFHNDPSHFQFAIVTDRTGGHRPGVFGKAVEKLNLLQPEFVMCVGDLIEGYTKESSVVYRQWSEFDSILSPLQMRFFYLPGNHDISNGMMRDQWLERYGRSYYSFRYQDVLFLAFDTNDGDGVMFSEEQINYFKQVIQDNKDVRWTLLFMHHPIWNYREFNGFAGIEELLKDRPYTVYAGHTHRYLQAKRQDRNYYILGTTGGGSSLAGPKFGQFDHITWITMTDDGPKMLNLALDGLLNHDVSNEQSANMARSLVEAAKFQWTILREDTTQLNSPGKLYVKMKNNSSNPIHFSGHFYHHHQLNLQESQIDLTIPADSSRSIAIAITPMAKHGQDIDPLILDWTIGYETDQLSPSFQLSGSTDIPYETEPAALAATKLDIFLDQHELALKHPFANLQLKYTLDGSTPSALSPIYEGPIKITQSSTLKARYFDPSSGLSSKVFAKNYRKVKPLPKLDKPGKGKSGLTYQYYEGNFSVLPDFKSLQAKKRGIAKHFRVDELAERQDHFALLFEGRIDIPVTGIYTFYSYSDDGSKVYLDDQLVVDNDGSHSAQWRQGAIALEKGSHHIRMAYFEDFLGEALRLYYRVPGEEKRKAIPLSSFTH